MFYLVLFLCSIIIMPFHAYLASQNMNSDYVQGITFDKQKDYVKALEWYKKAASQNNAWAQYRIGRLYEYGLGVPQDYIKAMEWYKKASAQNHVNAQDAIGRLYDMGQGMSIEDKEAMEWLEKND